MLYSYGRHLCFCLRLFYLEGKQSEGRRSFARRATRALEPVQAVPLCCGLSRTPTNAALCTASPVSEETEQRDHSHDPASENRRPPVVIRKSVKQESLLSSHVKQDAPFFEGEGFALPSPRRGRRPKALSSHAPNAGVYTTLEQECSPADAYTVAHGNTLTVTAQDPSHADAPKFTESPTTRRRAAKFSSSSDLAESTELLKTEGISQVDLEFLSKTRGFLKSSPKELSAALHLLKPFAGMNACKIITRNPGILSQPIDHLKAKLTFFQSFGMSPKVIARLGTCGLHVFTMKTDDIIQRLNLLKTWGFSEEDRERILQKAPVILRLNVGTGLHAHMAYLRSKGMDEQELLKLIVRRPEILGMPVKSLAMKFAILEDLGLSMDECFKAIVFLCQSSAGTIKKIYSLLRSTGFTDEAIHRILKKQPDVFARAEKTLELKLHYLIDIYERDREEIAHFPTCLCYDLKKRVLPRLNALREINPHKVYRLSTILPLKQEVFCKRYAIPDSVVLA